MALFLIGDIQGCDAALQRLLDRIAFSPSRDTLYLLGDLVNRGPESAAVLRRLMGYGTSARCLLGNHDLHLLATAYGVRRPGSRDTLDKVLLAPDRQHLLHWLQQQPLAILETYAGKSLLMAHAGVLPAWTATKTIAYAEEVEAVLQSNQAAEVRTFLAAMYSDRPNTWSEELTGMDRLRMIVNVLTRLRFCTAQGVMDFDTKEGLGAAPAGYLPWFDVPGRQTAQIAVAFGHWSTLGWLNRSDVFALDTGCVWGGCLSALRIEPGNSGKGWNTELMQVQCRPEQAPDS